MASTVQVERGQFGLVETWRFDKIPQRIWKQRGGHTRPRYLADEDQGSEVLLRALKGEPRLPGCARSLRLPNRSEPLQTAPRGKTDTIPVPCAPHVANRRAATTNALSRAGARGRKWPTRRGRHLTPRRSGARSFPARTRSH